MADSTPRCADEFGRLPNCEAGRTAFFGGHWRLPCIRPGRHVIGIEIGADAVRLCDEHFGEVASAGLVPREPITEERYRELTGGHPLNPTIKRAMTLYGHDWKDHL